MARAPLSPELDLLLACCRWPVAPEAVRACADRTIDWPAFGALLARHGVVALAGHALRAAAVQVPVAEAAALERAAQGQTQRSLRLAGETARWAQRFAAAGIDATFLKGATLAQLAYGGFALKRSSDIDLLVAPDRAMAAHDLLLAAGYAPVPVYAMDRASLARYWRRGKEMTFVDARGAVIDLHVRLADNPRMLSAIDGWASRQTVVIGAVDVVTFADPSLYAYLCYHGAAHGWSRIKWLADLNAFLAGRDIAQLHAAAGRLGMGTASGVALRLCRDLLGRDVPPEAGRAALAGLHRRVAMASIRYPVGGSEVGSLAPVSLALTASKALIPGGAGGFAGALAAQWMQPVVRARYTGRRAVIFHALRVPRFLAAIPRKLRRP